MKRELNEISKQNERIEKDLQNKMMPLKKGKIIGINMNDLAKADLDDIIKFFSKNQNENDDDDDNDEDDGPDEDKNGIYI
jgi:phage terminase Nu1 subunit (DNA packaging protein)